MYYQRCSHQNRAIWLPANAVLQPPSGNLHLYGTCLDKIDPVPPPLNLWDGWKMSAYGKPELDRLCPPPRATPPDGFLYPEALEYRLNKIRDNRWHRGFYYMSKHDPLDLNDIYERMMHITMPPNVGPREFSGDRHIFDDIPSMAEMPIGTPFVNFVDGDDKKPVTFACIQTMDSLVQYAEAPKIQCLVDQLLPIAWGSPARGDIPAKCPIFEIDGLKKNNCSAKSSDPNTHDGSYNLASTILQGNGVGIAQPAVQSVMEEAVEVVGELTSIFSQLYRLILPTCISKEEWDVTDFHAIDNNIYGFGGLEPNNTGLQMNISSLQFGGPLLKAIGASQGWFHTDSHDDHSRWTLFTLLFRVPPGNVLYRWFLGPFVEILLLGCDPGAFILA